MLATQRGHKNVVKALVEQRADPNITHKVGVYKLLAWITMTALWVCVQTTEGTALHFASKQGNAGISRILLGGGANVEIKDKVLN